MSELIFPSDEVYGNAKHPGAIYQQVIKTFNSQYVSVINRIENQYQQVENKIQNYLNQLGGDGKAQSVKDIEDRSTLFHRDGDLHMIDPINLKDVIEQLKKELGDFVLEADASISENNAMTFVDIDLTE